MKKIIGIAAACIIGIIVVIAVVVTSGESTPIPATTPDSPVPSVESPEAQLDEQEGGMHSASEELVFKCLMCGKDIQLNASRYQNFNGYIICPSCNAPHYVYAEESSVKTIMLEDIWFDCPVCGDTIALDYKSYVNYDGYWYCPKCKTTFCLRIAGGKLIEVTPHELTCPYCGKVITFE